jgi:hypothetical protein
MQRVMLSKAGGTLATPNLDCHPERSEGPMQRVMLSKAGGTLATPNPTVILSGAKDPCNESC